jgi:hypothetical protein
MALSTTEASLREQEKIRRYEAKLIGIAALDDLDRVKRCCADAVVDYEFFMARLGKTSRPSLEMLQDLQCWITFLSTMAKTLSTVKQGPGIDAVAKAALNPLASALGPYLDDARKAAADRFANRQAKRQASSPNASGMPAGRTNPKL